MKLSLTERFYLLFELQLLCTYYTFSFRTFNTPFGKFDELWPGWVAAVGFGSHLGVKKHS